MKTTSGETNNIEAGKAAPSMMVMPEPNTAFQELWMEVFIAGDKWEEQAFAQMLIHSSCTKALSPDEADVVIFTGGADVNPALYNQKAHPQTQFNKKRDEQDMLLYRHCCENGIPMIGVCRGAQFGWVMHGGELYQHVDNHYGDHGIWDVRTNSLIPGKSSSVHHQMVKENDDIGAELIADVYHSTTRWLNDMDVEKGKSVHKDIEAFFFRDNCFLGTQGHPEYRGYSQYTKWFINQINHYIIENPDIELLSGVRRIKPDLVKQRSEAQLEKIFGELV